MEATPQSKQSAAESHKYFVEFSKPSTGSFVAATERISEDIGHIEVVTQGRLYVSEAFRFGNANSQVLLRIPVQEIALPLTKSPDLIVKLYGHLRSNIILIGVQHLSFKNCRFPVHSEFPILRKLNNQRVYQLAVRFDRSQTEVDTIFENSYEIGKLTDPGTPSHAKLLLKKAVAMPKEDAAAITQRLLHSIASICLKQSQGERPKDFVFSSLHKQAYWDEFSTELMSPNSLLFHAGDAKQKKHVFVDIDRQKVLITSSPTNNSIPQKVNNAAMILLPNGNYLLGGGVECDNGKINYDGLYYYNPRQANYIKIGELPHYIQKHTLHYYNGYVLLFGGSDPKEESKTGNSSVEPGMHGSSIYRYNLAKRKWQEQKLGLQHRVNDRVYSYFYKDKLIVTRKNGDVEVIGFDTPKDPKSDKVSWAASLFTANLSIFGPATFFVVSGQLYVLHKRANEELKKYKLQKFIFKPNGASLTLVEELELNSVSFAYVKTETGSTSTEVTETVYLFEQDDISFLKFVGGNLVKQAKGTALTKNTFLTHKEPGIISSNVTNWIEACTSPIRYVEELEYKRGLSALPQEWVADSDIALKPVISGLHHCFWPLITGQTLLFGYFERVAGNSQENYRYRLNTEALTLRNKGWGNAESVLRIPSCTLSTIRHGIAQVKSHILFFGGLESNSVALTAQEITPYPISTSGKLAPTASIVMYTLGTQIWKKIGLLPEPLYGCVVTAYKGTIVVTGGYRTDNTLSKKVYFFDLSSFLLQDYELELDLDVEPGQPLQSLQLEGFLFVGTSTSPNLAIVNLQAKTVLKSKCELFHNRRIFSADLVAENQSNDEYCFLWTENTNPNKLLKKIVKPEFGSGGIWITPEPLAAALADPEEIQTPYADPVLEKEYKGDKDASEPETAAAKDANTGESGAVQQSIIKDSSFAIYPTKADFYSLDQLDHSRCYADFSRENNFMLISEKYGLQSQEKGTAGDTLITKYSYTEDRFTVVDSQESVQLSGTTAKAEFTQGLVSHRFLKNSLQIPLADGSVTLIGGDYAQGKKLVASNQCWITNLSKGLFSQYTRMSEARSHHTGIRIGAHIYVFGGKRGASGEVLASCERYSIKTQKWKPMPNLPVPVCSAACTALFGKIYILGGENAAGEAVDTIQIYDVLSGVFESAQKLKANLQLPIPLKNFVVLSVNFCTFFVAGGETTDQKPNMNIYTFDFSQGYHTCKHDVTSVALYPHVGAKASMVDGTVMIVGGNDFNGVTAYNLREKLPKEITTFREARSRNLLGWTGDGLGFCEVRMEYYIADTYVHSNPLFDKLYIFGMDQRNEIWRLHLKTQEWELLETPKNLNLWNYSIAVTLPDGRIFISGGIKSDLQKIQKEVFIVTPQASSLTAVKLPDMLEQRYTHTSVYLNNYVYCIGGRTMGDNNNGIHSHCERFNLQTKQWEQIANLNSKRCTATATSYRNHIYVLGGYQNGGRCAGIERYSESKNEWSVIPLNMDIPIEASVITHITDSEIILLGGKDQFQEQKYSTVYDLESSTCLSKPEMKVAHVLAKGAKYFNEVFIVGGSTTYSIEKCHIWDWKWEEQGQVRIMPSKDFSKTSYAQSY